MHSKLASSWLLALPVLLLACSKPAAKEDTSMASGMAMGAMAAPQTATLAAKGNSGITGSATLETKGDSVTVTVTLTGAKAGTAYPTHIHMGDCTQPGAVVAPLTSVTAGADGSGTSTTTLPAATLQGQAALLIQSHQPDDTPAACGDVTKG